MTHTKYDAPVRIGVFNTVEQADHAVTGLLANGFEKNEISVICSNRVREEMFKDFKHPPLPEEHLKEAVATGGSLGAIVGGLTGPAWRRRAASALPSPAPFCSLPEGAPSPEDSSAP